MLRKIITLLSFSVILAGCTGDNGAEYIGEWQHIKYEKRTMKIERNGDNYIIRTSDPSMWEKEKFVTKNIPATLKDGMLQYDGGLVSLVIDKASGNITSGNAEFKRLK